MNTLQTVIALIILILSTARVTRLIGFDHYPPSEWLRGRWDRLTDNSDWNLLLHCPYCLTPYVAAAHLIAAGLLGLLPVDYTTATGWFWLITAWLALSYAATYVLIYDGDEG